MLIKRIILYCLNYIECAITRYIDVFGEGYLLSRRSAPDDRATVTRFLLYG